MFTLKLTSILPGLIGLTLFHSLWIGLIIFMIVFFLIKSNNNIHFHQYLKIARLAVATLVLGMLASFTLEYISSNDRVLTPIEFKLQQELSQLESVKDSFAPETEVANQTSFLEKLILGADNFIYRYRFYLLSAWIVGVVVFGIRWISSKWHINKLRKEGLKNLPARWQHKLDKLALERDMLGRYQIMSSNQVPRPIITGQNSPIIIVPEKLADPIKDEHLEAIINKALDNIQSFYYLAGYSFSALEIILFYHPLYWWLDAMVKKAAFKEKNYENPSDESQSLATKYHILNRIWTVPNRALINHRSAAYAGAFLISLAALSWFPSIILPEKPLEVKSEIATDSSDLFPSDAHWMSYILMKELKKDGLMKPYSRTMYLFMSPTETYSYSQIKVNGKTLNKEGSSKYHGMLEIFGVNPDKKWGIVHDPGSVFSDDHRTIKVGSFGPTSIEHIEKAYAKAANRNFFTEPYDDKFILSNVKNSVKIRNMVLDLLLFHGLIYPEEPNTYFFIMDEQIICNGMILEEEDAQHYRNLLREMGVKEINNWGFYLWPEGSFIGITDKRMITEALVRYRRYTEELHPMKVKNVFAESDSLHSVLNIYDRIPR